MHEGVDHQEDAALAELAPRLVTTTKLSSKRALQHCRPWKTPQTSATRCRRDDAFNVLGCVGTEFAVLHVALLLLLLLNLSTAGLEGAELRTAPQNHIHRRGAQSLDKGAWCFEWKAPAERSSSYGCTPKRK